MFLATGGLPAGLLSADIAMVGGGGAGTARLDADYCPIGNPCWGDAAVLSFESGKPES
jgi:hypothetical protein